MSRLLLHLNQLLFPSGHKAAPREFRFNVNFGNKHFDNNPYTKNLYLLFFLSFLVVFCLWGGGCFSCLCCGEVLILAQETQLFLRLPEGRSSTSWGHGFQRLLPWGLRLRVVPMHCGSQGEQKQKKERVYTQCREHQNVIDTSYSCPSDLQVSSKSSKY